MLEVKHLKKEYRTKKGAVTRALDDVSLNFPETGMVFILGKSGSGKSTLLNVCGGLDRMDSGEIIIKGKSSNDFSGQDFDSYRNTYVGFVFQEYNILDEFTVEQNIALALELQNKKPDKAAIDKILADVDMTEFASRKPNTLSGGQKQRVAIARALVKEPEIIMADEPTGALDSKTGQQVFDTLKKLSKEKLVLVISHDRDFAEQYGDRIIELKDGKIISDQTRAETDGQQNVKFYGTDTVCVSSGSELTDDDLKQIKSFLAKAGGTAVISTSREKIAQFKEDRPEIDVGTFENIKEQPVPKQYEPQKLIRSHLPIKHAVKMGAGSLKTKPIRLVFTIFLSVIAFVLFGLASTLMLFDGKEVKVQSFTDSNINYISLGKVYYVTQTYDDGDSYTYDRDTKFTDKEYEDLAKKYEGAVPMISYNGYISNLSTSGMAQQFYSNSVNGLVPASAKLNVLKGKLPENDDEVAITDFMFDAAKASGSKFVYGENNTQLTISSYDDILWSETNPVTARMNGGEFKIVGVFKGMEVPNDYKDMKNAADNNEQYDGSYSMWTWNNERENGLYMTVAVTDDIFKSAASSSGGSSIDYDYVYFKASADSAIIRAKSDKVSQSDYSWGVEFDRFSLYEGKTLKIYGFDGTQKTALANGEAAISIQRLVEAYDNVLSNFIGEYTGWDYDVRLQDAYYRASEEYEEEHPAPDYDDYYYYNEDLFDQDHRQWETDRNSYIQQIINDNGYEEGSEEYNNALDSYDSYNPEPKLTEWIYRNHDSDKYKSDSEKYQSDRNAYAEAAREAARDEAEIKYTAFVNKLKSDAEAKYLAENPEPSVDNKEAHDAWQDGLWQVISAADPQQIIDSLRSYYYEGGYYQPTFEQIVDGLKVIDSLFEQTGIDIKFLISNDTTSEQSVKIEAFFVENANRSCYLGSDLYATFYNERQDYNESSEQTKYEEPKDAYIRNILIPYDQSEALITELLDISGVKKADDSAVKIKNAILEQLDMVIDIASTLETGFIIAGAVLALFAFLLMFNFISASITAKKKEIGILRAIGARTTDVFKIFVSEALIIATICFAIAAVGTFGLCILLNTVIVEDVGLSISLFVFGPISVLCVLGVALLTALVSTIIPVAIYSRKPPIASIRAL